MCARDQGIGVRQLCVRFCVCWVLCFVCVCAVSLSVSLGGGGGGGRVGVEGGCMCVYVYMYVYVYRVISLVYTRSKPFVSGCVASLCIGVPMHTCMSLSV